MTLLKDNGSKDASVENIIGLRDQSLNNFGTKGDQIETEETILVLALFSNLAGLK